MLLSACQMSMRRPMSTTAATPLEADLEAEILDQGTKPLLTDQKYEMIEKCTRLLKTLTEEGDEPLFVNKQ